MEIMKRITIWLALCLLLASCRNVDTKKEHNSNAQDTLAISSAVREDIPPIETGEFTIDDSDFGATIDLKGEPVPVNHIFKVQETQMLALSNLLLVKNRNPNKMFMAFTLPDLKFIKDFGEQGKGPFEFKYPTLVKNFESNPLCYVHDNGHLFYIDEDCEVVPAKIELPYMTYRGDLQMYSFSDSLFYYIDNTSKGKAILRYEIDQDTSSVHQVHDLAFSQRHSNWASYIGDLGASKEYARLVYAYKYFRRITFMDTEGEQIRTLTFKTKDTKAGTNVEMLAPDNVTHYWGISPQKNHVYFLYSGRTPIEVHNENRDSSGYIFVEQFDWNGNPIRRFKLDHWGYFCVSHDETMIYQFSNTEIHPIVKYQLPAL
jgi:hypothetical protein